MVALQRRLSRLNKLLNSNPDELSTIAEDTTVPSKSVKDECSVLKSAFSADSAKEREEHLLEEYGYNGINTAMRMYVRSLYAAEMETADRNVVKEAENCVNTIHEDYEEREEGGETREAVYHEHENDVDAFQHSFDISEVSMHSVKRSCVSTLTLDEKHFSEPAKRVKDASPMRSGIAEASEHDTTLELLTAESTDDHHSSTEPFFEPKFKAGGQDHLDEKDSISGGFLNMVRQLSDAESKQCTHALSRSSSRAGSARSVKSKPRSILRNSSRSKSLASNVSHSTDYSKAASLHSFDADPVHAAHIALVGSVTSEQKSVKSSTGTCTKQELDNVCEGSSKDVSILSSDSLKTSEKKIEETLSIPMVNDFHSSPILLTKKNSGTGSIASRLVAKLAKLCENKSEIEKQEVTKTENEDSAELEIPAVASNQGEEAHSIPVVNDFQSTTRSMASKLVANFKKIIERKSEPREQDLEATIDELPKDSRREHKVEDDSKQVKDNICIETMIKIVEIKNSAEEPGYKSPANEIDAATREFGIWIEEMSDRARKTIVLDHGASSSIACDSMVNVPEIYRDFEKSIERTFFTTADRTNEEEKKMIPRCQWSILKKLEMVDS
jgi:hypothetical protein